MLWPWASLLATALGVATLVAWQITPHLGRPPVLRTRPLTPQAATRPAAGDLRRIRLFFLQASGDTFKEQEREIAHKATLADEVRAVLRELTHGGPEGHPPLPPGVQAQRVFIDSFGIAYVDFTSGIRTVVSPPGPEAERAILAVVTSLTTSFSEIKRVQFLVDGEEMTVGTGGLDLRHPIQPRFPGEELRPVSVRSQG